MIHTIIAMMAGGESQAPADPLYSNVISHLRFEGTNGDGIFEDQKGFNWASSGATTSSNQVKFGQTSGYFPTNTFISRPASSLWSFGTGDFCEEMWVYPLSFSSRQVLFSARFNSGPASNYGNALSLANGVPNWSDGTAWRGWNTAIPLNQWTHLAVTREGGTTLRIFINGVQTYISTNIPVNLSGDRPAYIGRLEDGTSPFNGYIDEVRITKGAARYTTNFTPPTSAFPTS